MAKFGQNSPVVESEKTEVVVEDAAKVEVAKPKAKTTRKARVGDTIDYHLGERSPFNGQVRAAIVTKIIGDEGMVQFNMQCVEKNDFPGTNQFPVIASVAPYDESGKPGTWRFRD